MLTALDGLLELSVDLASMTEDKDTDAEYKICR